MPQPVPPHLSPAHDQTDYLRWERQGDFFRPDYRRSLTAILPTMLALLGADPGRHPTLLDVLPAATPRRARKVLLLTLDSFGYKEMEQSSRFQPLHREFGTWITSVFPSITSAALSSIYQALPPARHGILGHLIWKDFPGGIVDMLRMEVVGADSPLVDSGFDVNRWKREPGILDLPLENGLEGIHLMPQAIVGSGLSAFCYGKTRLQGFADPVEGLARAGRLLADISAGWVGMYLATIDTLGHVFGGDSPQVGLAVRHIEDGLNWMATTLDPAVIDETLLMIVADHGQSAIREHLPLEGDDWEWLEENSRAVGFSGRVMHLYLDDADEGEAMARLKAFVGLRGTVCRYEEVCGLAGAEPDDNRARQSLGDLVAILNDGCNWIKPGPPRLPFPYGSPLISQHGAMSREEMIVPITVAPLAALLGH